MLPGGGAGEVGFYFGNQDPHFAVFQHVIEGFRYKFETAQVIWLGQEVWDWGQVPGTLKSHTKAGTRNTVVS